MKKCPICGEYYADTYKRCPFCEEDENPRKAKRPKRYEDTPPRRGLFSRRKKDEEEEIEADNRQREEIDPPCAESGAGEDGEEAYVPRRSAEGEAAAEAADYQPRRSAPEEEPASETPAEKNGPGRRSAPDEGDEGGGSRFKIIVILLVAVIAACLIYLFAGPLGHMIGGDEEPAPPSVSDTVPGDEEIRDSEEDEDWDKADSLELSHEDVTIGGGETFTLTPAAEGEDEVIYKAVDDSVVSVSDEGVVTGLKKGMTEIRVKRGNEKGICIVRVNSDAADSGTSGAVLSLDKTDVTIGVGESCTLDAGGAEGVSWGIEDPNVATVDVNGKVVGVGAGKTTVIASWNGQKQECIVRVG